METPDPIKEPQAEKAKTSALMPTAGDHENARIRQEIAEAAEREYVKVLTWALVAFGPGWLPCGRHFLVTKAEEDRRRREGGKIVAAATVFTVRNGNGDKREFTVTEDGQVVECEDYKAGFGAMLLEPSATHGFEKEGKWHAYHKYSLCWAPFETYDPKSAEELAALRITRAKRKAEREQKAYEENFPLFAWMDNQQKD